MQTPSQLGWYATVSLLSQHHNLNHTAVQKKYLLQVDHDVDLTGYGRGQAKSVQQLWREVSHCPAAFAISKLMGLKPNAQSSAGRRRRNSLQCVRQSSNTVY